MKTTTYRVTTMAYLSMADRRYAPRIVSAQLPFLSDPTTLECALAARALGRFGEPAAPAVPRLIELLQYQDNSQDDYHVRRAVANGLGRIGDASAPVVEALLLGLEDENALCRECCALALW